MSHYKPYPKYKNSGVKWLGNVPEHWGVQRSKYIFREVNERSLYGEETLLSVSEYYGVKPRKEVVDENEHLSRAESLQGYKKCDVGDLVMNIMLAWKRGLGVTDYSGIVSPAYSVFRCFSNASSDFMHSLLRTDTYTSEFKRRSTGVIDSRLRMYPETFGGVEILVPSLSEQTQIATFLDRETTRIDALIEKKQKLIELLKEKRQALITQAVTKGLDPNVRYKDSGVEWLGEVPEHWDMKRLKQISPLQAVGVVVNPSTYVDENGDVPFIYGGNIREFSIDFESTRKMTKKSNATLAKSMLRAGDLVSVRVGDPGVTAVIPNEYDGCNCASVMLVRKAKTFISKWLCYAMNSHIGKWQVYLVQYGAAQKQFNLEHAIEFRYPFPSLKEQQKIVEYLDNVLGKISQLIEKSEKTVLLLKERRSALITAAVTGQIDVRDAA